MKYYKIEMGFDKSHYIPIDETELEKALYIHLTGKGGIFKEGSVIGTSISAVVPDYVRAMGWNAGYKMEPEDFAEVAKKGIDKEHREFTGQIGEKIQYLIETKQEHLIGKNVEVTLPAKNHQSKEISEAAKTLADKFKVKYE